MAPLVINVIGNCIVRRLAERAVLTIKVSSTDGSQSKVAEDVRTACTKLQEIFTALAPKTSTGHFAPDAAVTVWTMSTLASSSKIPYNRDPDAPEKPREYTASSTFEVTFRNFSVLGDVSGELLSIPFVSVTQTNWQLTEGTKAELEAESRKGAMRDAIRKANDLAEVLGRKVDCVEVKDEGFSIRTSRGAPSQELGSPGDYDRRNTATTYGEAKLKVEPEALQFDSEVEAKFAAE